MSQQKLQILNDDEDIFIIINVINQELFCSFTSSDEGNCYIILQLWHWRTHLGIFKGSRSLSEEGFLDFDENDCWRSFRQKRDFE